MAEQIAKTTAQVQTPTTTTTAVNSHVPTVAVWHISTPVQPVYNTANISPATPVWNTIQTWVSPTTATTPTIEPGKPVWEQPLATQPTSTKPLTNSQQIAAWEQKYGSDTGLLNAIKGQFWENSDQYNHTLQILTDRNNLWLNWQQAQTNVEKTTTTTPEWTTTVAKETPNPVVDQNARAQEITNNLNAWYNWDQAIKSAVDSWDLAKFQSSYNMSNPAEAKIVQDFFNAHQPKTSDDYFNLLTQWVQNKWTNPNSQPSLEQVIAQHRYDLVSPYKWASVETYLNAMNQGKIVPNTPAYNDIVKANWWVETPEMLAAKQQYNQWIKTNQINNDMSIKSWTAVTAPDVSQKVSDSVTKNIPSWQLWDFASYLATNHPELSDQHQKVVDLTAENNELNKQKELNAHELLISHPWMTKWMLYLMADQMNADLDARLFDNQVALNWAQSTLDYNTNIAQKSYDYQFQQQQTAAQYAQQEKLQQEQQNSPLVQMQMAQIAQNIETGKLIPIKDVYGNTSQLYDVNKREFVQVPGAGWSAGSSTIPIPTNQINPSLQMSFWTTLVNRNPKTIAAEAAKNWLSVDAYTQSMNSYLGSSDSKQNAVSLLVNHWWDYKALTPSQKSLVDASLWNTNISGLKPAMTTLNTLAAWAGNTPIDHMWMLSQAVDMLDNKSNIPAIQEILKQVWTNTWDPRYKNIDGLKQLVAEEVGKAYWMGTGWEKASQINAIGSTPAQIKTWIQTTATALSDKYKNSNDTYKRITWTDNPEYANLKTKIDALNPQNKSGSQWNSQSTWTFTYKSPNWYAYSANKWAPNDLDANVKLALSQWYSTKDIENKLSSIWFKFIVQPKTNTNITYKNSTTSWVWNSKMVNNNWSFIKSNTAPVKIDYSKYTIKK